VMDGEFLCEDTVRQSEAVGGGNFLILGRTRPAVLAAAERAVAQMRAIAGIIMPFPGGVVRSGSKIGSKYKGLIASTNHAFCPTLKGAVETALPPAVDAVLEIVIDGLTAAAIGTAMAAGIRAACAGGGGEILRISAGNYGGKLGPFHFHLRELLR
jgi:formylmethanofuran--tetrahydromethanopterin N-formyltransferase